MDEEEENIIPEDQNEAKQSEGQHLNSGKAYIRKYFFQSVSCS